MDRNKSNERNWAEYYATTGFRPPRPTLVHALDAFERERSGGDPLQAVDLGCGNGRDTVEMLRRGWHALAIDAEESAIESLLARTASLPNAKLETRVARFEDAAWGAVDLVNSSFALSFCPPDRFPDLWRRIVGSLRPGGRFSGQLFGERDSWAGREGITLVSRDELDALLGELEVERLDEEEEDGVTPRGTPKHWHIWHIVARKAP